MPLSDSCINAPLPSRHDRIASGEVILLSRYHRVTIDPHRGALVTATEDVQRAVDLHKAGRLDEAQEIYAQVLSEDPDQADALHFMGLLSFQRGQPNTAIGLIKRAIDQVPHYADAHSNLGNILKEAGHYEAARTSYENALACEPDRVEAHNNLGVLLRHLGEGHEALEHQLTAVGLAPESAWAQYNLGNAYASLRYPTLAVQCYERAVELDSSLTDAYRLLGFTLYGMKRIDEARRIYRRLLQLDPTNAVGQHLLAACSGGATPDRASPGFVRETFAQFASSFDGQLERLSYRGPEIVERVLSEQLPAAAGLLRVLDMGCGTGLCGRVLKPWANRLVGVDLSPEMLARAQWRECYDDLVEGDLLEYLDSTSETFDLIVSADTLIYFGELGPVLRGVSARLVTGGLLVFTLECYVDEGREGFRLEASGRYSHHRTYVESRLRGAGLELVALETEDLRREFGEQASGWIVSARKP